jgi:hypothetical protein
MGEIFVHGGDGNEGRTCLIVGGLARSDQGIARQGSPMVYPILSANGHLYRFPLSPEKAATLWTAMGSGRSQDAMSAS